MAQLLHSISVGANVYREADLNETFETMTEQTQKNDLESLSQAWSERVKGIRHLAQKGSRQGNPDSFVESASSDHVATVLPDEELFAGAVYEDLSVQQIFAGDNDFYKTMDTSPAAVPSVPSIPLPAKRGHWSLITKILIGSVILIGFVFGLYSAITSLSALPVTSTTPFQQTEPAKSESINDLSPREPEVLLSEEAPVSLKIAQDYSLQGDYGRAVAVYNRLLESLPQNAEEGKMRDFLKLKMALCMGQDGEVEESERLLKIVSKSRSVIVKILANYHLCLLDMQKRQYLTARSRAYQTIALLDAIGPDVNRMSDLRRNCYFLLAEAITRQILSLSDIKGDVPPELWPSFDTESDLFADMDEQSLRAILTTGSQELNQSLLGPKIEAIDTDSSPGWTVNCNGASIGEMMGQFSVSIGYDVHWKMDSDKSSIRNRSVNLYLRSASEQQCIMVTAGCAGLLAAIDDNNIITISDPTDYSYNSEHIAGLRTEAISSWQRFLVIYYEDPYFANVYFALGLLRTGQNLIDESLSDYKMLANRFPHSNLAPHALMNSAKLKMSLHDYPGACSDLMKTVEQYADYQEIERAYLSLADVTVRMDRYEEAAKLYRKVYYMENSAETQAVAAFASSQIYYQGQDFTNAEKWLTRYIDLEKDNQDHQFYQACLLLGKTWRAMGNSELSCDALRTSLSGQLDQNEYIEAVSALVEGYIEQEKFIQAIETLNEASSRHLSQDGSIRMLLLKSRSLRGIGLIDNAIVILNDREEYLIDNLLKAQVSYELSECYIEQGELDLAYKKLSKTLGYAAPGPMTHKILYKLVDVCLLLGLDSQAESICSRLLSLDPPEPIKQKTLEYLAAVYNKQKNYDRAALALLGQWQ